MMKVAFKKKLISVEKNDLCLGGAKLEAFLEKASNIMKDLDMMEKIHSKLIPKFQKRI